MRAVLTFCVTIRVRGKWNEARAAIPHLRLEDTGCGAGKFHPPPSGAEWNVMPFGRRRCTLEKICSKSATELQNEQNCQDPVLVVDMGRDSRIDVSMRDGKCAERSRLGKVPLPRLCARYGSVSELSACARTSPSQLRASPSRQIGYRCNHGIGLA